MGEIDVPAYEIVGSGDRLAVVLHGYGGCKEEILGLAADVACRGFDTLAIDLRGHGASTEPFGRAILDDVVELVAGRKRRYRGIAAIGHSLGGRIALLSGADLAIAISPPLRQELSDSTRRTLKTLRGSRVDESGGEDPSTILTDLPTGIDRFCPFSLIWAESDFPEIREDCSRLVDDGHEGRMIGGAFHGDVHLHPRTFAIAGEILERWASGI